MVRASFLGNILRTEIIHTWDSHMLGHEGRREFNTQNDTRDTTRVGRCSQTHPLALGWLKWWEDPKCVPLDRDRVKGSNVPGPWLLGVISWLPQWNYG